MLLGGIDVFRTVLYPTSGMGPVSRRLDDGIWSLFRVAARTVSQRRRGALLAYAGPVQVAATMLSWFLILLLGWSLVYYPAVGEQLRGVDGAGGGAFSTALYYSGFTLTTLGVGDVVAVDPLYRMFTVVEAGMGFGVITMVVTYFLSVYSALPHRNAFALGLHQRSHESDDAAVLVAVLLSDPMPVLREHLSGSAALLREIEQTHRSYPVLRYFHYRHEHYALPRLIFTSLDLTAVIRSSLDREAHGDVVGTELVGEVERAATSLVRMLVDVPTADPPPQVRARWLRRQRRAASVLAEHGLHPRTGPDAEQDYAESRAAWDAPLAALADAMLYRWDDRIDFPPEHAVDGAGVEG